MRYFTNNPLERLMMQKPKAAREDSPPAAAKEHFCYGCKRFGQSCVRPCYRDVKRMEAAPCAFDCRKAIRGAEHRRRAGC